MSWKPEVDRITERGHIAAELGGAEAVDAHHAKGRRTIRERIDLLADPESFREQGRVAGHTDIDEDGEPGAFRPANYVLGLAKVAGRLVAIGGEDFTQRGGSPSPAGLRKSLYAERLALDYRVPLVRLLEGAGGSIAAPRSQGAQRPMGEPVFAEHRFYSIMQLMGVVPVVSVALGPVAGFPAARLAASHFSVMSADTAQVMIAGPAVVERALGRSVDKGALGGAEVHGSSGVVDNVAPNETSAIGLARQFLSYLPGSVFESAPRLEAIDPVDRIDDALLSIVPRDRRKTYKMRRIIERVLDEGSFLELQPLFGRTQITGLARLAGQPVGVLANDPRFYAGAMTADGAQKLRRFVDLCDTFHLPIIAFVDEPGFMIGPAAEKAATIRHGVHALFSVVQSTVPWASVIVRKVFGVAGAAHFGPRGTVFAWPSAETGALPIEGGIAVAFRRQIAEADDPEAMRAELEREAARRVRDSAFARAEAFSVHDLIDPRETRPTLAQWIEWIQPRLKEHTGPRAYTMRP